VETLLDIEGVDEDIGADATQQGLFEFIKKSHVNEVIHLLLRLPHQLPKFLLAKSEMGVGTRVI
jgi:hypothetical protein